MDNKIFDKDHPRCALVFSGGVALGAYQAGAYATLHEAGGPRPGWIAATSIGAVNAAIITGNPPERRVERLRQFWGAAGRALMPPMLPWSGLPLRGPWRAAYNWSNALQARVFGNPGLFRPRVPPGTGWGEEPGQFDLAPLKRQLADVVDFRRLNDGELRLSVVATNVETGERVVFDTRRNACIGPEHLLASCGLLPVFAPVEINGQLLADGGFVANAPLDLVLDEHTTEDTVCFVVDLFSHEGVRPGSLLAAMERAGDLIFGNQFQRILEGCQREHRLRAMIARLAQRLPPELCEDPQIAPVLAEGRAHAPTVLCLRYRAGADEAGPEKMFDFSPATLADRWQAGALDMQRALRLLETSPTDAPFDELTVHHVRRQASTT
jgi:NTE family protein